MTPKPVASQRESAVQELVDRLARVRDQVRAIIVSRLGLIISGDGFSLVVHVAADILLLRCQIGMLEYLIGKVRTVVERYGVGRRRLAR